MNDNTELLTWAVENITTWNDDYTHLRSDASRYPFYTRDGKYGWLPDRAYKLTWASDDNNGFSSVYKELAKDFSTTTLQVITKQEWQAAKASSNALKTACKPQQGHIHAELMAEYAIVAKTNPEPWKEFEMQYVATGDWLLRLVIIVFIIRGEISTMFRVNIYNLGDLTYSTDFKTFIEAQRFAESQVRGAASHITYKIREI